MLEVASRRHETDRQPNGKNEDEAEAEAEAEVEAAVKKRSKM